MAPVVVCGLAVLLLLFAERFDHRLGRVASKLAASTAFVWAALAWGALGTAYGRWVLAGLLCCWIGDALLLSPGRSGAFQGGIAAFLLGHLAYAGACLQLAFDPVALMLTVLGAVVFAGVVGRWLRPHVSADFVGPVAGYVVTIAAMLALAAAASLSGGPAWLGLGALGFAASDLSVARDRFIAPAFRNAAWGLPLYFGSQLALARSVTGVVSGG